MVAQGHEYYETNDQASNPVLPVAREIYDCAEVECRASQRKYLSSARITNGGKCRTVQYAVCNL